MAIMHLLIPTVYSGGMSCGDAGVDDGFLITVDGYGRRPFGYSVRVDAPGPATGGEIVMVVTANQSQIAQIRFAALNPGNDVMSFAPFRGSIAAGNRAAGVAGVEGEG